MDISNEARRNVEAMSARLQAQCAADPQVRQAVTDAAAAIGAPGPDHADLIRRLAYALDAVLPYLRAQAMAEKSRETGKALRSITKQEREEGARRAVDEAFAMLGIVP